MSDKVVEAPIPTVKRIQKPLPPPFPVSPVIKVRLWEDVQLNHSEVATFFRWSLLLAGIFYGSTRRSRLAAKEVLIREEERKKKAIRDAELAELRHKASERDIAAIAKMFK